MVPCPEAWRPQPFRFHDRCREAIEFHTRFGPGEKPEWVHTDRDINYEERCVEINRRGRTQSIHACFVIAGAH
jgi:hypothetical protein